MNNVDDINVSRIAQELGLSKSAVSMIKNGKYPYGDETRTRVEERLRQQGWTPADDTTAVTAAEPAAAFETQGQKILMAVLQATLDDGAMTLAVGASGIGKTHVASAFRAKAEAADIPVHYLKCQSNLSPSGLSRCLCEIWQVKSAGGVEQRVLRLRDAIRHNETRQMLILDESDLLHNPRRPEDLIPRLEIARELYEAGLAVALVGLPVLEEAIRSHTGTYFWSRLGYYAPLQPPQPDELFAFCARCGIQDVKTTASYARQRGYFRLIETVSKRAGRVGENAALGLVYLGDSGRKPNE